MPTLSAASCTVRARSVSSIFLASTTFRRTSGTAFCFTTKYLLFSSIAPASFFASVIVRIRNTSVVTWKMLAYFLKKCNYFLPEKGLSTTAGRTLKNKHSARCLLGFYSSALACRSGHPRLIQRRYALIKSSKPPSRTASTLPLSCPVRRSFTMV